LESNEEATMWTRRVLLATIVAAAAMSLPRRLPASWALHPRPRAWWSARRIDDPRHAGTLIFHFHFVSRRAMMSV